MPNIFSKSDKEPKPTYSFSVWCDKQFLSGDDRARFRLWLGHQVGSSRTNREWFALWDKYVRKTRDK